jgi:hypothetical protein
MSVAAAQASKFYEQVVVDGKVFTFMDDDSFLVFRKNDKEVIPFWSSRTRLEKIAKMHPKYSSSVIFEFSLAEFMNKTLLQLEEENICIGVNWSGPRLVGYNIPISELRTNIAYWQSKHGEA